MFKGSRQISSVTLGKGVALIWVGEHTFFALAERDLACEGTGGLSLMYGSRIIPPIRTGTDKENRTV